MHQRCYLPLRYLCLQLWRISCCQFTVIGCVLVASSLCAGAFTVNQQEVPKSKADLVAIQDALVGSLEACRMATVSIRIGEGFGSGVIVSPEGLILTAAHVTAEVNEEMTVILNGGSEHKAISMGLHSESDAAMMRIIDEGEYPYVNINKNNDYRLGHWVFALGHAGGFDLERGAVVRLGRIVMENDSTLHTDCKVIGGDSGGPLFDMGGELIGIHSRVSASLEQNMHVPIREYLKHWDALKGNEFLGDGPFAERPDKGSGFLGFASTDTEDGLLIGEMLEDGPAANAGIETGDIILELEGEALTDKKHFQSMLKEKTRGEEVELLIMRNGEQKKMTVKLGER